MEGSCHSLHINSFFISQRKIFHLDSKKFQVQNLCSFVTSVWALLFVLWCPVVFHSSASDGSNYSFGYKPLFGTTFDDEPLLQSFSCSSRRLQETHNYHSTPKFMFHKTNQFLFQPDDEKGFFFKYIGK